MGSYHSQAISIEDSQETQNFIHSHLQNQSSSLFPSAKKIFSGFVSTNKLKIPKTAMDKRLRALKKVWANIIPFKIYLPKYIQRPLQQQQKILLFFV